MIFFKNSPGHYYLQKKNVLPKISYDLVINPNVLKVFLKKMIFIEAGELQKKKVGYHYQNSMHLCNHLVSETWEHRLFFLQWLLGFQDCQAQNDNIV